MLNLPRVATPTSVQKLLISFTFLAVACDGGAPDGQIGFMPMDAGGGGEVGGDDAGPPGLDAGSTELDAGNLDLDAGSTELSDASFADAGGDGNDPFEVAGNPTCAELAWGFELEVQLDDDDAGPLDAEGDTVTVSASPDRLVLDWSSTGPFDAVMVKAGSSTRVYPYDPPATADVGLRGPTKGGLEQPIGTVRFCR